MMAEPGHSTTQDSSSRIAGEIPKNRRGVVVVLSSITIGLVLARFMMISTLTAIIALLCGAVLAVTILLRKVDYLILVWIVLTSLIFFIMGRLFPPNYYEFVGRGIFWGLLVCIIAARAMDNVLRGRQFVRFDCTALKVIILFFLLWCVATLFTSLNFYNSVKKVVQFVIALGVSYTFYDFFSEDENNIKRVLMMLLVVASSISVITVLVAVHSIVLGEPIYKKISLWFINPNVLGYLLFPCIPVLISAGFYFIRSRFLKRVLVFTMLLALFFSFHRTSWLATLVAIGFLLWKGRMRVPIWTTVVIALFIAGLLFPAIGGDAFDYLTEYRYTGRDETWKAAWITAWDYPLLGTGPGNVRMVMPQYIVTPWLKAADTHSVYLTNAAEMGFPSVFILLAVYIAFLVSSLRIERELKSDYLRSVTMGVTATFLGLLVHGIFENGSFLSPFVGAEFFVMLPYIFLGLPFACKKLDERTSRPT